MTSDEQFARDFIAQMSPEERLVHNVVAEAAGTISTALKVDPYAAMSLIIRALDGVEHYKHNWLRDALHDLCEAAEHVVEDHEEGDPKAVRRALEREVQPALEKARALLAAEEDDR